MFHRICTQNVLRTGHRCPVCRSAVPHVSQGTPASGVIPQADGGGVVSSSQDDRPYQLAEFDIRWGTGIDAATDLLDRALEVGVVAQKGSHFSFGNSKLGQGREKAREKILETDAMALAMKDAVAAAREGRVTAQA